MKTEKKFCFMIFGMKCIQQKKKPKIFIKKKRKQK